MRKVFSVFFLIMFVLSAALPFTEASADAFPAVCISEVMTKNKATLPDPDGDFSDWIELWNPTDQELDLSGWTLVKNGGSQVWTFPAFPFQADSRLLVFASKKDRPWPETPMHTNFALSERDSVALYDPEGNLVSSCDIAEDKSDYAYALQPDGSWQQTPWATPGFENTPQGYDAFMNSRTSVGPLVINEVCVDNFTSYYNDAIEYSDWVEIKNISDTAVDLSQYCLTDDASLPAQYFLSGILYPGGLTVVLCNKDAALYTGNMPIAPFSLNSEREELFLYKNDRQLVDYAALHEIPYKGTYGRGTGTNGFSYLFQESPGSENGFGERRVSSMPVADGRDGVFQNTGSVTVSLSAPGEIYYTLDCSAPTTSSTRYTGPVSFPQTMVLRAISVEAGALPSRPLTLTYILNEGHSLPVVSLVADDPAAFHQMYTYGMKGIEHPGCLSYYGEDGSFSIGCGIKMNGETSLVLPKKNMSVRFRGSYGKEELAYDLFNGGASTFTNLVLRAGQDQNNTIIRNELCYALTEEFSDAVITERFRYCIVYLNGEYNGIYALMEKPNEALAASRLGVKKADIELEEASVFKGDLYSKAFTFIYDHDMADPENYRQAAEMIDLDSLIDWCILQSTFGNYDLQEGNLRYARDITHGSPWKLMLYDLDVAFFHISYCVNNVTTFGNQVSTVNMKMLTSPVYRGKYLTRSAEAYRGVLSEEHICAEIDRLAAQVAPEVARDATVTGMNEASWIAHLDSLKAQLRDGWITANMNELFSQLSVTPEEQAAYFGSRGLIR